MSSPANHLRRQAAGPAGAAAERCPWCGQPISHAISERIQARIEAEEGEECGRIVYGSKRRRAWRNDYLTSLRADQLAARAEHAILATQVLPAGASQIHLQDGVIVLNPARTVLVAAVLRKHIVQLHALRRSGVARADKVGRVYAFITSDRFKQLLVQIETDSRHMLDLDVKEKTLHDATWERRGHLIRSVERVRGELRVEIDRLIGNAKTVRVMDQR